MDKKFKENNGCAGICCKGCGKMDAPLNTFDWLAGVPENEEYTDIVEVQFKNTIKVIIRTVTTSRCKRAISLL